MILCDITQFYSPTSGGVRRYLDNKMAYVRAGGRHRLVVIVPGESDACRDDGAVCFHTVRSPRLPGSLDYRLLLRRDRLRELLEAERPDLVEVGDPFQVAWFVLGLCRRRGIPVVSYYHSDAPRGPERALACLLGQRMAARLARCGPSYVRSLQNRMDATLVASQRLLARLAANGVQRLVWAPLGVDTHRFRPRDDAAQVRAQAGIPDDAMLLLFVGRLSNEKRLGALVRTLRRLNAAGDRTWHLALIGDGQGRRTVARWAHNLTHFSWIPFIEDADQLARWYTTADVLVHAGANETFGLSPLEGQACGTPAVVVAGSGLEEGVLVGAVAASRAPSMLARAIGDVLAGDAETVAAHCRRRVTAAFDLDAVLERQFAVYEKIVAGEPLQGDSTRPEAHGDRLPH